jgi:predicted metal-binding membrane protein
MTTVVSADSAEKSASSVMSADSAEKSASSVMSADSAGKSASSVMSADSAEKSASSVASGHRPAWLRELSWHHPEWTWAAVSTASWVTVALMGHADMDHPYRHWLVMVAAMMLPPALPMIRYAALAGRWRRRHWSGAAFVIGLLLVWAAAGVVARTMAGVVTVLIGPSPWGVVGALAVAAMWELTPAKKRFLRRCHWIDTLPPDGWPASAACVRFGMRYGRRGVGAGWALMFPMAMADHAGLGLMLLLAVIIAAEELLVQGTRLTRAASAALLGVAALMAGGS